MRPRWFHWVQHYGRMWANGPADKFPYFLKWFLFDFAWLCERWTISQFKGFRRLA